MALISHEVKIVVRHVVSQNGCFLIKSPIMENWILPVCVFGLLIVSPEISKDQPLNLYFSVRLCAKTVQFQQQGKDFLYTIKKAHHNDLRSFKSIVNQMLKQYTTVIVMKEENGRYSLIIYF